jgi:hypothetical protein
LSLEMCAVFIRKESRARTQGREGGRKELTAAAVKDKRRSPHTGERLFILLNTAADRARRALRRR